MKWVQLLFQLLTLLPINAITISIGSGQVNNQPLPLNASSNFSYSQTIYLQQEIQHSGLITQISYPYHIISNVFLSNVNQMKIYMGHSSRTGFQTNDDWFPLDSLQLVYEGNWDVSNFSVGPPGDGWVTIPLSTHFNYDNARNLVIAVDENQPGATGISDKFICTSVTRTRSIEYHSDSINPDPISPPDASSFNPRLYITNIRLEMITEFPPPSNPYPVHASASVELLPIFSWVSEADRFDLLLGMQADQLAVVATSLVESNWSPSLPLQVSTTYYWQVRAYYGEQNSDSPVWFFTTGNTSGFGIPFQECFDLNIFPPQQWLRMEGLDQPNATITSTIHGWNWDYFGNEGSTNGSAKLNIYGRDCYYWLISPPISGTPGSCAIISFRALLTDWNAVTPGQLGDDDKVRLVLFSGLSLSSTSLIREWTSTDSISGSYNISMTLPAGVFRIGIYGESTVSNHDCDLFFDSFRILMESSVLIEPPGNPAALTDGNSVHLQWTSPISYVAAGYRIYRNNHLIGTANLSAYEDLTVIQGQNYSYFITALNDSGLESAASASTSLSCTFTAEPLFEDGFESFAPFTGISVPWMNLDVDMHDTFGLPDTDYPNEGNPSSFLVFNPQNCTPPFTSFQAYEGQQFLAVIPDSPPPNNDWLMTPKLHLGTGSSLSFKARSLSVAYGAERFRVGISTTDAVPDSFLMISNEPYIQAPAQWTEFAYDLTAYDGQDVYLGIQCVSYDCCLFALDAFKVISQGGYVGNEDNPMPQSDRRLSVYPNPFSVNCRIELDNPLKEMTDIQIFNIRGQRVMSFQPNKTLQIDVTWNGRDERNKEVAKGVYIVRISVNNIIICRKIVKL